MSKAHLKFFGAVLSLSVLAACSDIVVAPEQPAQLAEEGVVGEGAISENDGALVEGAGPEVSSDDGSENNEVLPAPPVGSIKDFEWYEHDQWCDFAFAHCAIGSERNREEWSSECHDACSKSEEHCQTLYCIAKTKAECELPEGNSKAIIICVDEAKATDANPVDDYKWYETREWCPFSLDQCYEGDLGGLDPTTQCMKTCKLDNQRCREMYCEAKLNRCGDDGDEEFTACVEEAMQD